MAGWLLGTEGEQGSRVQAAATTGKGAESQVRAKHKDEKDSPRISEKVPVGAGLPDVDVSSCTGCHCLRLAPHLSQLPTECMSDHCSDSSKRHPNPSTMLFWCTK